MIPVDLQDGLESRVVNALSGLTFRIPDGEEVPINVYKQQLPERETEDDLSLYPYVIIKLSDGEQSEEGGPQTIKVLMVIGVFDEGLNNQGYRDVTTIIQKIHQDLLSTPLVNKKFILEYPFKWVIHDEDVYPFYFGGIEMVWSAHVPQRIGTEGLHL